MHKINTTVRTRSSINEFHFILIMNVGKEVFFSYLILKFVVVLVHLCYLFARTS